MKNIIIVLILATITALVANDNPFENIEVKRFESKIVKEFNRFDFLESIVSDKNGTIYVTNLPYGMIYKIKNEEMIELAKIEGKVVGLTLLDQDNLIVSGSNNKNEAFIYKVNTESGASNLITKIPEAILLNGMAKLSENHILIADSFKGVIWQLNIENGLYHVWEKIDLLASPAPEKQIPGVNGLKIKNEKLYFSNSGKKLIGKINITSSNKAGRAEIIHENVFVDDFDIGSNGNIYGATHTFDSVIKITPDGEISIIAQHDQGVIGSTCIALYLEGKQQTLLVSTNGGILKQNKCDVVPAKIVELHQ